MRLEAVSKRYGRRAVLAGVDLDLPESTCLVVTGGNGSGKSTLLRVLAGLTSPSGGTVTGRPPTVAFVPERFAARLGLTAHAYLRHHARIRGMEGAAAERRIAELVERLGIGDLIVEPLWTLSRGSAQKISIAQAFLAPTGLLVLDEPWSGLDRWARPELTGLIADAVAAGSRVVLAEHLPEYAVPVATAAAEMVAGRLAPLELTDLVPPVEPEDREYVEVELVWPYGEEAGPPPKEVLAGFLDDADTGEEYDATGGDVWLRVNRPDVDGLLAAALAAGWSVYGVYPATAESPEDYAVDGGQDGLIDLDGPDPPDPVVSGDPAVPAADRGPGEEAPV